MARLCICTDGSGVICVGAEACCTALVSGTMASSDTLIKAHVISHVFMYYTLMLRIAVKLDSHSNAKHFYNTER